MDKPLCDECKHEEHWELFCPYSSQSEYVLGSGCICAHGPEQPTPFVVAQLREQVAKLQTTLDRITYQISVKHD